jgi:hypothetical protein
MQKEPLLQFEGFNWQMVSLAAVMLLYTIPGTRTVAELHPPGHVVPLGQSPEQALEFKPSAEPNFPAEQPRQRIWLVLLWYCPSGHKTQSWAPAELSAFSSNFPAGQALQLDSPDSPWYLPAGHRRQLNCAFVAPYFPGTHSTQATCGGW